MFSDCFENLGGRGRHGRLFVAAVGIGRLVEKGVKLIVFPLREGVVLVVVALGAAQRQAHPDLHGRINAVLDGRDAKLLVVGSPFRVGHRVAMKGRRHKLLERRLRQQVAGDLLDGELVERQVAVQGVDHPVAVAPNDAQRIGAVAFAIGIARQIEPDSGPALAVRLVGHKPVDQPLVGIRIRIGQKPFGFGGRRRQAAEVEAQASQQRVAIGLGRRTQFLALEPGQNEIVDRVFRPGTVLDLRPRNRSRFFQRPVPGVIRPLVDPLLEKLNLLGLSGRSRVGRGHALVAVGRRHAP